MTLLKAELKSINTILMHWVFLQLGRDWKEGKYYCVLPESNGESGHNVL